MSVRRVQESMLQDLVESDGWTVSCLRYFNPAGAHSSGSLGEVLYPSSPLMLVPLLRQVALGQRKELKIFGDDYDTKDGTAMRDYIHIQDLADAHVAALQHLLAGEAAFHVFNLGTGFGRSVLEVLQAYQDASGCELQYKIEQRRAGDAAVAVADSKLANDLLGWYAHRGFEEIMASDWTFALHTKGNDSLYNESCLISQHLVPEPYEVGNVYRAMVKEIQKASKQVGSMSIHSWSPALDTTQYVIDLGGTYLRAFKLGPDGYLKLGPVKVPEQLKLKSTSARDLFDFMASAVAKFFQPMDIGGEQLCLVFSFALESENDGVTRMRRWAKDWATSGVEGANLTELMDLALKRQKLPLRVSRVMNNCISSVFALGAIRTSSGPNVADAAVVVGTGTNACYVDRSGKSVFSTEWAGFRKGLPSTAADVELHGDELTLEKMVSGLYLPRIVEQLCPDAGSLSMKDLVKALEGPETPMKTSAQFVIRRSAYLCAQALAALIEVAARGKPDGEVFHVLLDGGLFHCVPIYRAQFEYFLAKRQALLPVPVKLHLLKDAASIGAAHAGQLWKPGQAAD